MSGSIDWFVARRAATEPSACLMLLPDEAGRKKINQLKRQLKLPEGAELTPDDGTKGPHITIRFWKTDGHPLDEKIFQHLSERLDGESLDVDVVADEWDIFGPPGEEDTLVLLISSPELMALQEELDGWLQEQGVSASDYDEYKPHISIAEGVTEVPARKPNLELKMSNWSLTEGKGGDSDYDEVWSLRAARWICVSARDPEEDYNVRQKFLNVLTLATAYVKAKANLAYSMRDQNTEYQMRDSLKYIDRARMLADEALSYGRTTPDFDVNVGVAMDLALEALEDQTIRLPFRMPPDVVRNSVADFYDLILRTPRRAERRADNSVERLVIRRSAPEKLQ